MYNLKVQIQAITEYLCPNFNEVGVTGGKRPDHCSNSKSQGGSSAHMSLVKAAANGGHSASGGSNIRTPADMGCRSEVLGSTGSHQPSSTDSSREFRSTVLETLHHEINTINRRSSNIVVSGLRQNEVTKDDVLFKDLFRTYLGLEVNVDGDDTSIPGISNTGESSSRRRDVVGLSSQPPATNLPSGGI